MFEHILKSRSLIAALWISSRILAQNADSQPEPKSTPPLIRAHAHNDYEHAHPLQDALDRGFCSIEPDIWLVEGRLLVGHDRSGLKPDRTLQSLYLDPLRQRVRRNGGRVYPRGPGIVLLVDVKSDGEKTYGVLRDVFKEYSEMLSVVRDGKVKTNAVTVIISGNRAVQTMASESVRYAFVDGRLHDLESNPANALVPLISDNWNDVFKWRWNGSMPDDDKQKLKRIVEQAHAQGRKLRFWATPDKPEVWKTLFDAGVDLINTDQLEGLQEFLLKQSSKAAPSP
jgi:hypothetical protein